MVLASVVIGAAAAAGATEVHRTVSAGRNTSSALVAQIRQQEEATDRLTSAVQLARTRLSADRARTLTVTSTGNVLATQLGVVEVASALTAVAGPGVSIRIADGAPAASDGAVDPARVTDVDLRQVVNALWAAGAEAIAVNGLRLGPQTAVRTAGSAVLVDFRPVSSPYTVDAIGDENALETGYATSGAASRLRTLASAYGIDVKVISDDRIRLAAASETDPVRAVPLAAAPVGGGAP